MFHRAAIGLVAASIALLAFVPRVDDWYPAGLELDIRASYAADVPVDWFEFQLDPRFPELTSTERFWEICIRHELWGRTPESRSICGIEIPPYSANLFQAQWITNCAGLDVSMSEDPEWLCNYVVAEGRQ